MAIDLKLVDQLLADYKNPEQIIGENGLLKQLTKAILERALNAEITEHLGYGKHDPAGYNSGNSRNGKTKKKLKGDFGEMELETPRDRNGTFEPTIVGKGQTRFTGFDDKILSMYARGMTTRDIQGHLEEIYGVEVSPALISNVTDAVADEVRAWQGRPLDAVYPIVYFDAMTVKVREDRSVHNRACYLALGVTCDGEREVLGIWWHDTEGAKFWLAVLNDLRHRGVADVLIACVDGLKGFPEAIEATFPQAWVQTCIVHLIRASLRYVNYRDKKKVTSALRPIYTAANADAALIELERFDAQWGARYPATVRAWRDSWEHVVPFLALPDELRRAVYTTNTIEGAAPPDPKAIKTRGHFPDEQSATKLIYLAIMRADARWQKNRTWTAPRAALKIHFGDRFPG